MSERHDALHAILNESNAHFRALLEQLTDSDLRRCTTTGWTVAQTAGHVTDLPYGFYVAKRLARGVSSTTPRFLSHLIDVSNWWNVRKFRSWSKSDLLNAWADANDRLMRFVNDLSEEALDNGGRVDGYESMDMIGG